MDSGFQILDSSLCQRNLDSGFQSLVGFGTLSCIPDSTKAQDSRLYIKAKFSQIPLVGAVQYTHHTARNLVQRKVLKVFNTVWFPVSIVL